MRVKRPAQRGQQCQHNACNDNSAMLARMPAQCGQGHQCNTSKTASARLAGHEGQVARERHRLRQQKTTDNNNEHDENVTYADVSHCIVTEQMPVCNADSNTGEMQVTSQA
jgi:hypothetical protein